MAKTKKEPPQSLIRERLNYDPETGIFRWRVKAAHRVEIGDIAGCRRRSDCGDYWSVGVLGHGQIGAQRLAWIYMNGSIPPPNIEIDHKNRNTLDNRIENLRLATSSQQKRNRGVQSNNRSGLKGAFYHNRHEGKPGYAGCKNWRSQIKAPDGKLHFLGYYHTPEEAHEAYKAAATAHYGEWACLG